MPDIRTTGSSATGGDEGAGALTEEQKAGIKAFKERITGENPASPTMGSGQSGPMGSRSNATAGVQSGITANHIIIENKPGPKCPDNILHNYANYTYKISLMCWDTIKDYNKDLQEGKWPLDDEKNKKILFSSGGIHDDIVTVSHPGEGGVSTANRHPEFDVDFYIATFSTTSIMGMSGESRATNIFECNMEVVEPIGATLLERFYTLVTRDGRENWAEFPLLIKIEFIGYNDAGIPEYIKPAKRLIPVRLINMEFSVAGDGTNYGLQFIASTTIKKDHPRNIKLESEELWGKTVKEFCDQFAENYNKAQLARTHIGANAANEALERSLAASGSDFGDSFATSRAKSEPDSKYKWAGTPITGAKVQEIGDEIVFDIDEKIAEAKILVEVAEDTPLDPTPTNAIFNDDVGGDGLNKTPVERYTDLIKKDKAARAAGTLEKEKTKENRKIIPVDPDKDTKISIEAGTKQIAIIEKIITFSEYIINQLKDVNTLEDVGSTKNKLKNKELLVNPDQGLLWWKISYIPTLNGWDDARGQYATKTIIQIEPYRVNDPVTTGGKCNIGEGVVAPAMRNYQYIYTGQNIDVKDFGIQFNNAFIQSMLGQGVGDSKKAKVEKGSDVGSSPTNSEESALTSASSDQIATSYQTGTNLTNKQKTASTILENLYRKLGSDMMQCSITIIGDPLYIQQDGILNLARATKTGNINNSLATDPASGAALCDHQDSHIFLSYKTPTDYNEKTGLMDFNMGDPRHRSSTLSGYYRVWEVENTFENGEFTQSLNLTRVYNQWREAKHNPKESGGGDDQADFTWGTHDSRLIFGSITTSGGSAKLDTTSESTLTRNQQKQLSQQKRMLEKQIKNERNVGGVAGRIRGLVSPPVLTERDLRTTSSNTTVANQNAINKQITPEAKIKFRAAEDKLASINAISDTSSVEQLNTFADMVNARGNNVTNLTANFSASTDGASTNLTPVFVEDAGVPTHTTIDGLRTTAIRTKSTASTAQSDLTAPHTELTETANNISVRSTTNNGAPLFNYNKKDGLYGLTESQINISSYTAADKASINTNEEIIRTQREILITSGDLVIKKAAYTIASNTSKNIQETHGKYGNEYKTWEEVGYFQNLLVS